MTALPSPAPEHPADERVAQIERWLDEQPAPEHEGETLSAKPFYVRADEEFGVALVAVSGIGPDGSDLELPFVSWWFRFENGQISRAWAL
ncbi:MAG TPA: hypothetical protein VH817_21235 [Thermoleophilaceae bacterium]|jgi:hypothetical protein